jgi:hypothetical protein
MRDSAPTPAGSATAGHIQVDSHVHIYPEYDIGAFIGRGLQVARSAGSPLLLLLAEGYGHHYFSALTRWMTGVDASLPEGLSQETLRGVPIRPTSESWSLAIPGADSPGLFLISGRQLISSENLEVLVIGLEPGHPATESPARERPARELIRGGLEAGGIAVLPWGFGKWLGKRGAVVKGLCALKEFSGHPFFFVGDILARGWPWPRPRVFDQVRVLPGTDILPLPGDESRLASYGFRLQGNFDGSTPCGSLMQLLREGRTIETVGSRSSLPAAVAAQFRYRLRPVR